MSSGIIGSQTSSSGICSRGATGGMELIRVHHGTNKFLYNIFSIKYQAYTIIIGELRPTGDNTGIYCRLIQSSSGGGTGNPDTSSQYKGLAHGMELTNSGSIGTAESRGYWNGDNWHWFAGGGNLTNSANAGGMFGRVDFFSPASGSHNTNAAASFGHMRWQGSKLHACNWHGLFGNSTAMQGIYISPVDDSAWASMKLWVYGHRTGVYDGN